MAELTDLQSRPSRLLRFEGMARWAVTARCGQLEDPPGRSCQFFYTGKHQRWQPKATLLWLRLLAPQSRAKIFLTLSQGAVFTLFGMISGLRDFQNLSVQTRLYLVLDGRTEYPVAALFPSNFLKLNKNLKSMIKGYGTAFRYFLLSLLQFSQNLSFLLRLVFQR